MKFRLIDREKQWHGIDALCAALGVSRGGYWAWTRRRPSARKLGGIRSRPRAPPSLLCRSWRLGVDEIGYRSYENRSAELLYEVISRRYKKRSMVLTTNLACADWPSVFPNASCAVAMVDRLIEHSSVISIQGENYRKRVAEQRIKSRAKPAE